jgi:hypothetical protein
MIEVLERKTKQSIELNAHLKCFGVRLIEISGYLTALRHAHALNGNDARYEIERAREALAEVSAAIDAYEAAAKFENEIA